MTNDLEIFNLIEEEYNRQSRGIELIASENFVSPAVMAAMGTCLTNKYAEGYPGKRYYGGCEYVDVAEDLAAIFTGQTRPLREFGIDLTQATLQEWAMKQGMDANIKTMSQAEKTMLIPTFVFMERTTCLFSMCPISCPSTAKSSFSVSHSSIRLV